MLPRNVLSTTVPVRTLIADSAIDLSEEDCLGADRNRHVAGRVERVVDPRLDHLLADLHPRAIAIPADDGAGQLVHKAHEIGDEKIGRTLVDVARRADLLHHALVEHDDAIRQRQRLRLVVRHVDERDPGTPLQRLDLRAHALAQLGVEIGQRLIEQQDRRLDHERAGERHALQLPARQLSGMPPFEALKADRFEHARDARRRSRRRGPGQRAARMRRCRTRTCAATRRSSGTPCPCAAFPAGRSPAAMTSAGPRHGSCPGRARRSPQACAASWSCRTPKGRGTSRIPVPPPKGSHRCSAWNDPNFLLMRGNLDESHGFRPAPRWFAGTRSGKPIDNPESASTTAIVKTASADTTSSWPRSFSR